MGRCGGDPAARRLGDRFGRIRSHGPTARQNGRGSIIVIELCTFPDLAAAVITAWPGRRRRSWGRLPTPPPGPARYPGKVERGADLACVASGITPPAWWSGAPAAFGWEAVACLGPPHTDVSSGQVVARVGHIDRCNQGRNVGPDHAGNVGLARGGGWYCSVQERRAQPRCRPTSQRVGYSGMQSGV